MEVQLELIDESYKTQKVNVQNVKIMYQVDKLIKCLPNEKAFGNAVKYNAHQRDIEDLY